MGGINTHSLKRAAHEEEKDGEQVNEARLTSIKKLRQLEQETTTTITRTPPCQPLGNLMLRNNTSNARDPGLGNLAVLPDEMLITIFSELEAIDLVQMQAVSHAMYAFSRVEGQWKHEFIKRNQGRLQDWSGNWRSTYLRRFPPAHADNQRSKRLPTDDLHINDVYSDALYVPYLSARYDANTIARSSKFADNILRVDGSKLSPSDLQDKPLVLTHLMDDWQALQNPRRWSLNSLAQRFPCVRLRAEAVLTTLADYIPYHDSCATDESPLYIFDADFVEKTQSSNGQAGLGDDFTVPHLFQDDLFSVLGEKRPNYRWLIAGPARSGSTFHCDPNATSAWNAVVTGKKLWILFPPQVTPPGIIVSDDQAEVDAPLSLGEWLGNYYHDAKRRYGPNGTDPVYSNTMLEGVCNTGEVFYVPSGWWHLVVNLEDSIAVTQNFVCPSNLDKVLRFLRYRPEQVSGFLTSEDTDGLGRSYEDESGGGTASVLFEAALAHAYPDLYSHARQTMEVVDRDNIEKKYEAGQPTLTGTNMWSTLQSAPIDDVVQGDDVKEGCGSFAFSFDIEM